MDFECNLSLEGYLFINLNEIRTIKTTKMTVNELVQYINCFGVTEMAMFANRKTNISHQLDKTMR